MNVQVIPKSFPGSDSKIPDRASIVTILIKYFLYYKNKYKCVLHDPLTVNACKWRFNDT